MCKLSLLLTLIAVFLHRRQVTADDVSSAAAVCDGDSASAAAAGECPGAVDAAATAEILPGPTKVGELSMIRWTNGTVVDPFAFQLGLPANVTNSLREFCAESGLVEWFKSLKEADARVPPVSEKVDIRGKAWYVHQRPAAKTSPGGSISQQLHPADDEAHYGLLRALGGGRFDEVLDTIGRHFGLDRLTVYSVGFLVDNHFDQDGSMHSDFKDTRNKTFNLIFPINLPKRKPELQVESRDFANEKATVSLEYDVALGVGDSTRHGTTDYDNRESGEMTVLASIYVAHIDESNVKSIIDGLYKEQFPPSEEAYLLKRSGVHWSRYGSARLPPPLVPERSDTLKPGPTEPGELTILEFEDGRVLSPYAFRVKVPSNLTKALREFCERGFQDLFQDLMGEGAYEPDDGKLLRINGKKWYVYRPAKKWHSNSHWMNPNDEDAMDELLRVFGDGGLDVVLEAIGRHFDLNGLLLYSPGFFVVSHSENGFVHDDFKNVKGKGFNLLVPIILPKDSTATLYLESNEDDGEINTNVRYEEDMALGVGDFTKHAAGDCDHRDTGEMRVMATIYMADIDKSNVGDIITHYTDPFPPADKDYLLTRSGIHWSRDGSRHLPRGPSPLDSGLMPGPTEPGELSLVKFGDGTIVDPFAFRVGLPTNLSKVLRDYCDEQGLTALFTDLMGSEQLDVDDSYDFELTGEQWFAQRYKERWETTSHWLSPNEKGAHEHYLTVLQEGGFDKVLEGIGRHFDLDGLFIYSTGFEVVDQCKDGFRYAEIQNADGAFFLLLPIMLPDDSTVQHHLVEGRDDPNLIAKVPYDYNTGIGVGESTRQITNDMDYRGSGKMLVMATVYLADINEDNVETLAADLPESFPLGDKEYLLKNRGSHWNKEGSARLPPSR